MIYAIDETGLRRRPHEAVGQCVCPICKAPVIRKSGDIMVDHFAHESREPCDDWSDQITEWHLYWQAHVQPNRREVICEHPRYPGEIHRSDMLSPTGHAIEVQHSHISPSEVAIREYFYQKCHRGPIWIVDAREFWADQIDYFLPGYGDRELVGQIRMELSENGKTGAIPFRWSHPRHAWIGANCPVYFDPGRLGDEQRAFDGALFRVLDAWTGDKGRWENYKPWDKTTHSPDGRGPGGVGAFVTSEEFRYRYKLHLPDKPERNQAEAYPDLGPHHTISELEN